MKHKVEVWVQTNRVGSKCSTEFEVDIDDDLSESETESQIEEMAKEAMFNLIEWNFEIKKP